ncbi:MAG: AbrB/MazE/SpoVT family DNA-binding domain-containing protein [Halanaerobiales bacterium]|nr:AbrB/MazE/SpoVT family DNA-binding domain-containing protein [Halanaerobiales bacterium]
MAHQEVIVGKISGRGNITIPKRVRECLNLEKGDHVIFRFTGDNHVILEKAIISSPSWKNKDKKKEGEGNK